MGLPDELGYRFRPPNALQRAMQALGASRPGAWLFSKILPPIDTALQRVTRGRHTLPGLLAGLPVVDVTTTGRRSGLPRTAHLIAVPHRDSLALLGTNFGQPSTPTWVLNLEADPRAHLEYRGRNADAVARPVSGAEFEEVLGRAESLYAGYRKYQHRITGRRLRIFVLDSVAG
ncbi:MAG: nitroreductase family deazaflavin-dependent oxidoreductase [Nocardioides sp.]|nr:nitroreductase family deazaflavin-dependent oxidoreductase [Nocardioidaceae bacterium]MCB8958407.1 nitroreductase family deazaflavin-dependent oxidoreductase [Nocardioides sp.]